MHFLTLLLQSNPLHPRYNRKEKTLERRRGGAKDGGRERERERWGKERKREHERQTYIQARIEREK